MRKFLLLLIILILLVPVIIAREECKLPSEQQAEIENKIRPILIKYGILSNYSDAHITALAQLGVYPLEGVDKITDILAVKTELTEEEKTAMITEIADASKLTEEQKADLTEELELAEGNIKIKKFLAVSEDANSKEYYEFRIVVTPLGLVYNMSVYEKIPKTAAQNTDLIIFNPEPAILEKDPLIVWHFVELDRRTELSYRVPTKGYENETRTLVTTEKVSKVFLAPSLMLVGVIIGVLTLPLIVFIVVSFQKFRK